MALQELTFDAVVAGNDVYSWLHIDSSSWTDARAGTNTNTSAGPTGDLATAAIQVPGWLVEQGFLRFLTSSIEDVIVGQPILRMRTTSTAGDVEGTGQVRARAGAHGAYPLSSADFVPGASLSGRTLYDTVNVDSLDTVYEWDIPISAINVSGVTEILLHDQRQESATAPGTQAGTTFIRPGQTNGPVLVLTVDTPHEGAITQTLGALTQAATAEFTKPQDVGVITQTLGSLSQTATATFTPEGNAGTITQTLGALTQTATATFTPPVADVGVITQVLGSLTQAATAEFVKPVDVGAITQTLSPLAQAGAMSFNETLPARTGVIDQTLGALTQALTGLSTRNITVSLTQIKTGYEIGLVGPDELIGGPGNKDISFGVKGPELVIREPRL